MAARRRAVSRVRNAHERVADYHASVVIDSATWVDCVPSVPASGVRRVIKRLYWFNYDSVAKLIELRLTFADPALPTVNLSPQATNAGVGQVLPGRATYENYAYAFYPLGPGDMLKHKMTTNVTATAPVVYASYEDWT